jgi:hypothetical protein
MKVRVVIGSSGHTQQSRALMSTSESTDARTAEPSNAATTDAESAGTNGTRTPFGRARRDDDAPSTFREAVASAWRFRR